jgi:hypothetical protein
MDIKNEDIDFRTETATPHESGKGTERRCFYSKGADE